MATSRPHARDLVEAIVANLHANKEELRYVILVPGRYAVYVSPAEHARLEGIIPRLRLEAVQALDEEVATLNRRERLRRLAALGFRRARAVENAEAAWHVEFLPDLDAEFEHDQDIIVQSDLRLPAERELGGERTRRVSTVHSESRPTTHQAVFVNEPAQATPVARLTIEDLKGRREHTVVRDSTTIGRGGTMFPVDVRVTASDDVSREHARIRRDPKTGAFFLIDLSTHGTTIDGQPVPRGFEQAEGRKRENGVAAPLPPRARIALAGAVVLTFERLR